METLGQGSFDRLTNKFKHYMALAVDPQRGPRGAGSAKMTCGMPQQLIKELLRTVAETAQISGKVVVDLCAGFQSLKAEVLAAGAKYVAVDLSGERTVKSTKQRRTAILLETADGVLAVQDQTDTTTNMWHIPSTIQQEQDNSLHAAAVRQLKEETGLTADDWSNLIVQGPRVRAMTLTTYYIYTLNTPFSQALLSKRFRERDQTSIKRVEWVRAADAAAMDWRSEDAQLVKELFGDRSGGC